MAIKHAKTAIPDVDKVDCADWNANHVVDGNTGEVLFLIAGGNVSTDTNLFWDNVNKRLGIGTAAPSVTLEINGNILSNNFNTTGDLVFAGIEAGDGYTGAEAVVIGYVAGMDATAGEDVFLGAYAGLESTGTHNIYIGYDSGDGANANDTTVVGHYAGSGVTGNKNVFLGSAAGESFTGSNSFGVGYYALNSVTAENVIAIGYQAGFGTSVSDQFILKQANVNAVPLIQGDFATGHIGIGITTPAVSALLDLTSITGALLIPRMTTAQKNALTAVNGMLIYDLSTNQFNIRENGVWIQVSDAVAKAHTQNTDTDLDATFEATFVKKADNVNVLNDITSTGANIEDAVTKRHDRQHAITTAADHTSTATPAQMLKADANGLPVDATNTDAQVSGAVTASHARSHAIDDASDHTSTITQNNLMDADASGLPDDSGLSVANTSDAITKKHSQNTDTILGTDCVALDHGAAATDMVINVCYGTGDPPDPATMTEGALWVKHAA